MSTICSTNGVHVLPVDQASWNHSETDLLVAACLDECGPCQEAGIRQACYRTPDEVFGQLFTTYLMENASLAARLGVPSPSTGADLFRSGLGLLHQQTRTLLQAVVYPPPSQLPQLPPVNGMVALSMPDASAVSALLARMSRQDRRLVLDDVLDNIVGRITLGPLIEGLVDGI